jgi:hypothetical protein
MCPRLFEHLNDLPLGLLSASTEPPKSKLRITPTATEAVVGSEQHNQLTDVLIFIKLSYLIINQHLTIRCMSMERISKFSKTVSIPHNHSQHNLQIHNIKIIYNRTYIW